MIYTEFLRGDNNSGQAINDACEVLTSQVDMGNFYINSPHKFYINSPQDIVNVFTMVVCWFEKHIRT